MSLLEFTAFLFKLFFLFSMISGCLYLIYIEYKYNSNQTTIWEWVKSGFNNKPVNIVDNISCDSCIYNDILYIASHSVGKSEMCNYCKCLDKYKPKITNKGTV